MYDEAHPSRRDNVYASVRRATTASLSSPHSPPSWATASQIAQQLNLDRANVSRELNRLHSDGHLIKVQGKPTLYISRVDVAQKYPGIFLPSVLPKDFSFSDYITEAKDTQRTTQVLAEASELSTQVGCNGTLKLAIQYAKAAVMYPPHGLHTLITGSVGVGKLLLAHNMFNHAKMAGRFSPNAPFITVNCREFASSPQAMLHQLFGYGREVASSKGEKGRRGLVDRASQGILCLIGIEKLPPIVQDNLTTLLEKNTYTRVGEPSVIRQASTMIIAISSEPPDSPTLQSIIQRIPVRIHIPNLSQWQLQEIAELVIQYFQREAMSTGICFKVSKGVFSTFLRSMFAENLGSISSAVRISCSLSYLDNPNPHLCEVSFHHLPTDFVSHVYEDPQRDVLLQQLIQRLDFNYFTFTPQSFLSDKSYREDILRILHNFNLPLPSNELSLDANAPIPILVWFHGEGVSQGVCAYVNEALSASIVHPIPFQADQSLDDLLKQLARAATELDQGKGILIATDIEPLPDLHTHLQRLSGTPCLAISNATTSSLVNLARMSLSRDLTLHELYTQSTAQQPPEHKSNETSFFNRVVDEVLAPGLSFIDPNKTAQVLNLTLDNILSELQIPKENEIVLRFLSHCSHMLERLIRGYPLHYSKLKSFVTQHNSLLNLIEQQMKYPAEVFGITIPTNELAYVAEIFIPFLS